MMHEAEHAERLPWQVLFCIGVHAVWCHVT